MVEVGIIISNFINDNQLWIICIIMFGIVTYYIFKNKAKLDAYLGN